MQSSACTEQSSQPHVSSCCSNTLVFWKPIIFPFLAAPRRKEGYLERGTGAAQKPMFTKHCRKQVFALHHEKLDGATPDDSPPSEIPCVREPGLAQPLDAHTPEALPLCQHKSYIGIKPERQRTEPDPLCSLGQLFP